MMKTRMEDNGVYELPNIRATSSQGACSVICSVSERTDDGLRGRKWNHQLHNGPNHPPEQIPASKAGEALTASSCSEILANVPVSVGYAMFEGRAGR